MGTILIVQADPELRLEWSAAIRLRGLAVVEVGDITEAVRHAREGGIDAVVLDSMDPARSARALIEELQRLPEPPPLILVSSSPQAPEQSAHLGAAAFVPKPCAPEDLAMVAEKLISARPRNILDEDTERRMRDL